MSKVVRFVVDTAHPNHPLFAERKRLTARILVARNLRAGADTDTESRQALDDLIRTALVATRGARARADKVRMDDFLTNILEELRKVHEDNIKAFPGHSASLRELGHVLTSFANEAQSISCANCTSARLDESVCRGEVVDDEIISNGALCLKFVTELFESLVKLSEQYYAPLLSPDRCEELHIILHTRVTPHPELGGKIQFPPDDKAENRKALITIVLPPDSFESTHLEKLAYVMFHEIFVHAAEGWHTEAKREETNERCAFREGFVDAAAVYALRRGLANGALRGTLYEAFIDDFRKGTESAHKERVSLSVTRTRGDDPEVQKKKYLIGKRSQGWNVFMRFEDKDQAEKALQLALCLNIRAATPDELTRLMQVLDRSSGCGFFKSYERRKWVDALLEAAEKRDLAQIDTLIEKTIDPGEF